MLFEDLNFEEDYTNLKNEFDYKIKRLNEEENENEDIFNKAREVAGDEAHELGKMLAYEFSFGIAKEEYDHLIYTQSWRINDRHVQFYNFVNVSMFCGTYDFLSSEQWLLYRRLYLEGKETEIIYLKKVVDLMYKINSLIGAKLKEQNIKSKDDKNNYQLSSQLTTTIIKNYTYIEEFNYLFPELKNVKQDFLTGELLSKNNIIKNKSYIITGIGPEHFFDDLNGEEKDILADLIFDRENGTR